MSSLESYWRAHFSGTMLLTLYCKFYPSKSQLRSLKILEKQLSSWCIPNLIIHQLIFPIFLNLKGRQDLFFHMHCKPGLNKMG